MKVGGHLGVDLLIIFIFCGLIIAMIVIYEKMRERSEKRLKDAMARAKAEQAAREEVAKAEVDRALADGSLEDLDPARVHFTAHRGAAAFHTENSMEALRWAASEKYRAVETDIHEAPDFYPEEEDPEKRTEFVVMHDSDLSRMTGNSWSVSELNEHSIRGVSLPGSEAGIPRLEDYLDIMKDSDQELYIELKDRDLSKTGAARLMDLLAESGLGERIILISFYFEPLIKAFEEADIREGARRVRFGLLASPKVNGLKGIEAALDLPWLSLISVRKDLLTAPLAEVIHAAGKHLEAWVCDRPEEVREAVKNGADRITTNQKFWV